MTMTSIARLAFSSALLAGSLMVAAAPPQPDTSHLVFQSGFEGSTRVEQNHLTGSDPHLPKSDWVRDLSMFTDPSQVIINYTGGSEKQRYADIVGDPLRPGNKVFHFWLGDAWDADGGEHKARVQLEFYGIHGGAREFRQSERVLLGDAFHELESYPKSISWLTISEFWNNEWWVKNEIYGFRITLGIGKPSAASDKLTFVVEAQDQAPPTVKKYAPIRLWRDGGKVAVPIGQWFTMEYYIKEGGPHDGRFTLWITPDGGARQKVFDVTGATHNTRDPSPNGFTGYNPMKLYTSSDIMDFMKARKKPLEIYWDDLKVWKYR